MEIIISKQLTMKILLLSILLLVSTSFSVNMPDKDIWIGTFEVYTNDRHELFVYYDGDYQPCFTKYVINKLFENCDTTDINEKLDSLFHIHNVRAIDLERPRKINNIRM